jgi:hypothetical protein
MNSKYYKVKVYALILSFGLISRDVLEHNKKKATLKFKLTIICAFSSQGAFKGPTLEHDTFSNLLNNGTRGALVPDETTLKKKQGYELYICHIS